MRTSYNILFTLRSRLISLDALSTKNAVRIRVKPVAVGAAIPRAVRRSKEPGGPVVLARLLILLRTSLHVILALFAMVA